MRIGGVEVRTGVEIPKDISWETLRRDFDAIFLGFGLGRDRYMELYNSDAQGIYGAVDYIAQLKTGKVSTEGIHHAIVVGGGNTAIDAVRELLGLGIPKVTMVYRGTESKMSGYTHEWLEAKKEGALGSWQSQPTGFLAEDNRVQGLRCVKMDAQKKAISGSEFSIEADVVVLAIGQDKQHDLVKQLQGLEIEWGKVVVNEHRATGCLGVHAGGDCINGGKEVVNAVDDGQKATEAIHTFLTGVDHG